MKKIVIMVGMLIIMGMLFVMPVSGSTHISKQANVSPDTTAWAGYQNQYKFYLNVQNATYSSFNLPVTVVLQSFSTGQMTNYTGTWNFRVGENIIDQSSFQQNGFSVNPFGSENAVIYILTDNAKPSFQISYPNAYFNINENGIPYQLYGGVLFGMYSVANATNNNVVFNGTQSFSGFTSTDIQNYLQLSFVANYSNPFGAIPSLNVYSQITINASGSKTTNVIQTETFTGSISFYVPKNVNVSYETILFNPSGSVFLEKFGNVSITDTGKVILLNITNGKSNQFAGIPVFYYAGIISMFFGIVGGLFFLFRSSSILMSSIPMGVSFVFFATIGWLPIWLPVVYGVFVLMVMLMPVTRGESVGV